MAKNSFKTDEENQTNVHHLVWLDKDIENDLNQQRLNQLHDLDERIKDFSNKEQCINYIQKQNDKSTIYYIIFIISDSFSTEVIPKIHGYVCILGIFIFCTKSKRIEPYKSPKIVSICTDIDELIVRIRNFININKTSIDFSLFNKQNTIDTSTEIIIEKEKYQIRNLKEDQARFLWFYKCHNFMIELEDDDQQAKQDMILMCRQNCKNSTRILKPLQDFEKESLEDNAKNAIHWYTQNSIIFRCINEALVSGNIETIYSYRYIIKLLCRQLKNLHREYKKIKTNNKLRLYRGQVLKLSEILLISKHKNDFISLNSFVSTSLEKDIAKKFCFFHEIKQDYEPVIFVIDIDMINEQSIAFADISHLSPFPEEEEILISIGSVFCIESVEFNEENKLYEIYLSLSQHEKLTINQYIEQTFAKEIDSIDLSVLFGKLLFDMGEYQFAIRYFQNRIECLSDIDNHHRATYLNNIGVCYNEIGEKDQALKYYKIASRFYGHGENHRGLGACYHNIANYYYYEKDFESATQWILKALHERQEYELEKATTLDLLGFIQLSKHNTEAAYDNFKEALKIRLKYWNHTNPNHPDIGISFQNLGRLDTKLSSYIDAQNNFLRAEEIFRSNYPESHPLMKEIRKYLKDIKRRLEQ